MTSTDGSLCARPTAPLKNPNLSRILTALRGKEYFPFSQVTDLKVVRFRNLLQILKLTNWGDNIFKNFYKITKKFIKLQKKCYKITQRRVSSPAHLPPTTSAGPAPPRHGGLEERESRPSDFCQPLSPYQWEGTPTDRGTRRRGGNLLTINRKGLRGESSPHEAGASFTAWCQDLQIQNFMLQLTLHFSKETMRNYRNMEAHLCQG